MGGVGERGVKMHNFKESLVASHAAEELPFWRETYRKAFPTMVSMINHRQDGWHQRAGVDRSIVLANSKQVLIDEKVRGRNKKTGVVYRDIALEYLSSKQQQAPGWVCKPLLCDYIAYAIAPIGRCYLLPVIQLQLAWDRNKEKWLSEAKAGTNGRRVLAAENEYEGRRWTTLSVPVTVAELFKEIGACLRITFSPCEVPSGHE